MVSVAQFREIISAYVKGKLNLEAFASKFSELSYNIRKNGDAQAIALRNQVETYLADLSAKVISEDELRSVLHLVLPMNESMYPALVNVVGQNTIDSGCVGQIPTGLSPSLKVVQSAKGRL